MLRTLEVRDFAPYALDPLKERCHVAVPGGTNNRLMARLR